MISKNPNLHSIRGKLCWADIFVDDFGAVAPALFRQAIKKANMNIVAEKFYSFGDDFGDTWVFVLAESHLAVHTYPEYNYFSVDVYTCGHEGDPVGAIAFLIDTLKPVNYTTDCVLRGVM